MKEKKICIYKITNIINNKIYIGSTIDYNRRVNTHLRLLNRNEHHSVKLQNSFNKYGEDNFNFTIIELVDDVSELINIEQKWLNLELPLLNMTLIAGLNSHIGLKRSNETKIKISKSLKGKKQSEEHRESNRISHIGLKQSNLTKLKKSESLKRYWSELSDDDKNSRYDKIRDIRINNNSYYINDEVKSRISNTLKNKKLQSAISIKIEKYDLNGNLLEIYPSILKAEICNNYTERKLSYHLVKKNKNEYGGFIWKIIRE